MADPMACHSEQKTQKDPPVPEAYQPLSDEDDSREEAAVYNALDEFDEPRKRFEESFNHTTAYEEHLDSLRKELWELNEGLRVDHDSKRGELKRRIRACQKLVRTERKVSEMWKRQIRDGLFATASKNINTSSNSLPAKKDTLMTKTLPTEMIPKHEPNDIDSDISQSSNRARKQKLSAKDQAQVYEAIKKLGALQIKKAHRGQRGAKKNKQYKNLEANGFESKEVEWEEVKESTDVVEKGVWCMSIAEY